jgi:hypothetical protein
VPQATIRSYNHAADFDAVRRFLIESHEPGRTLTNWVEPRWQYMHYHPFIEGLPRDRIGVVEEDGESARSSAYSSTSSMRRSSSSPSLTGSPAGRSGMSRIRGSFWTVSSRCPRLPDGFRLQSLEDENDLRKINAVLWRGFDHEGPPPDEGIPGREHMQRAPGFRKDLTIVAITPEGDYASFAGMWIVPENRIAYVEPVATDPEYRRMGLGTAADVGGRYRRNM